MDTKNYRVSVGSPNIMLNRRELELRAQKLGMSESLIEELNDTELNHQVTLRELQMKEGGQ